MERYKSRLNIDFYCLLLSSFLSLDYINYNIIASSKSSKVEEEEESESEAK
jgi:hypothetical protein